MYLQVRAWRGKGSLPVVQEKLLCLVLCFYFSDVCNKNQQMSALDIFLTVPEHWKPILIHMICDIEILK